MMVVTYKVKNPLLLQAAFSQCFITARKRKHQVLSPVRRRGLCTLQACLKLVWSNSVSRCVSAKLTGQNERQMVIRLVQMIDKFILLVNPAELFTTVAFSPHCAENHCEEWGDFKTTETEVWNALVQLTKDKSWTVVYILYWKIKYSGAKGNQIILCSKKGQHYRPHRLWLPSTPSAFNPANILLYSLQLLNICVSIILQNTQNGLFYAIWYGCEWGNQFKNDKKMPKRWLSGQEQFLHRTVGQLLSLTLGSSQQAATPALGEPPPFLPPWTTVVMCE